MGAFSHGNPCAGINLGVDDDDDDVSLAQLRDQLFSRGGAASVAGANVTAPGVNATDPGVNATASAPGAITTVSSANVTASVFGGNVTASGANVTASVLGGNVTASAANLAASGNNNLAENNAALKRPVDSPADKDKGNGKAKGKSANRKPPKSKKSLDMQVHAHVHVLSCTYMKVSSVTPHAELSMPTTPRALHTQTRHWPCERWREEGSRPCERGPDLGQ